MSLITGGPNYVDDLDKILVENHLDWEHFERLTRGEITVSGLKYSLRVGLHLNAIRKAIICAKQFVRFKPFTDTIDRNRLAIIKLDPAAPDDNLYYNGVSIHQAYWHPNCPVEEKGVEADWTILDAAGFYRGPKHQRRMG